MSNPKLTCPRARRGLSMGLLSTALLLLGALLLLAGGLWHWHQNGARRSYLNELERKVASIPVSGGESTAQPLPAAPEVVALQPPSAAVETTASDTQSSVNQEIIDLIPENSPSLPGNGTAPRLRREFTTAVEAAIAPEDSADPRSPAGHPSTPVQTAAVLTVKSAEKIFKFTPVAAPFSPPLGSLPPADKIRIPAIDLVSTVAPMVLLSHQGQLLFSIQKGYTGWVPNTGNPGENSRGWYLGHQTDVFKRLPDVVEVIADGKPVDIILEVEKATYLYRVTGRPVIIKASDFDDAYFHTNLFASGPEIVLTTCVPPRSSEYRFLLKAALVGQGVTPVTE